LRCKKARPGGYEGRKEKMKQELAKMICDFFATADTFNHRDFVSIIAPKSPEDYIAEALDNPNYRNQILHRIAEVEEGYTEEAEAIRQTVREIYKEG